jgi:hypothetical protein
MTTTTTKQPSREQLADELQLIRAKQLQLQRQVRDLGYAAAKVSRHLLELSPQASKTDTRLVR